MRIKAKTLEEKVRRKPRAEMNLLEKKPIVEKMNKVKAFLSKLLIK